jgi:hypothetical protein
MVGSFGRPDQTAALTLPDQLAPNCYGEVAHEERDTAVSVGNMLVPRTMQAIIARPLVGATYAVEDALAAFGPAQRGHGEPISRVIGAGK